MFTIGISAYYHDSAACLFKDGKLIFACEEEKFTGIKHDKSFPKKTIDYIYRKYGVTDENLETVCFYEQPKLKHQRVVETAKKNITKNPIFSIRIFYKSLKNIYDLNKNLKTFNKNVFYSKHHDSHIYYSSYSSPFKSGLVVSIDGVGEYETTTFAPYFRGSKLEVTGVSKYPHSLGLFYSAMTSYLGFKPNEGEYKVMGLGAYGKRTHLKNKLSEIIYFNDGGIHCDMKYFDWDKSDKIMYNKNLYILLGIPPRLPDTQISKEHKDLARAVQEVYEDVLFSFLNHLRELHKTPNIMLGGGCAYNGLANGKIPFRTNFSNIWIPPSPSDSGSSIGACINYYVNRGVEVNIPRTPFLGPSFNVNKNFKKKIKHSKSFYANNDTINRIISKELSRGKVIGWFKNEIEFGARALGGRSILADPRNPKMKKRINDLVKKREGFRPFAPMVTKERQADFFESNQNIPYMNQVIKVKEEYRDKLPAITHIDGTARVQTVNRDNPIHSLLREFEKITSYPILLNTSFNIKDKTMVLTPQDAMKTFEEVDIDILILQNFIIYKQ